MENIICGFATFKATRRDVADLGISHRGRRDWSGFRVCRRSCAQRGTGSPYVRKRVHRRLPLGSGGDGMADRAAAGRRDRLCGMDRPAGRGRALFAILLFQVAMGMMPFFNSAVPFRGPVLIAVYSFTAVLMIATAGDAKLIASGGIWAAKRIARHLWQMRIAPNARRRFSLHQ